MSTIRLYTDEDVYGDVARWLREKGFDSMSTPEAGRIGTDDISQLQWAAQQGRVLLTFNVAHFVRLNKEWLEHGHSHCGIVVSQQRHVGDTMRRTLRLLQTLSAEQMLDRLEFLGDWPPR